MTKILLGFSEDVMLTCSRRETLQAHAVGEEYLKKVRKEKMKKLKAVSLEEQVKKVYVCTNCGRKFPLDRHRDHCPYCNATLIVVTTRGKGEKASGDV